MSSEISFWTPVYYGDQNFLKGTVTNETIPNATLSIGQKIGEIADCYLHLGSHVACAVSEVDSNGTILVRMIKSPSSLLTTIVKIASYVTIILPLIALIAKCIYRSVYFFAIEKEAIQERDALNIQPIPIQPIPTISDSSLRVLKYDEVEGSEKRENTFKIKKTGNGFVVHEISQAQDKQSATDIIYNTEGMASSYQYDNPSENTKYTIARSNGQITAEGIIGGKLIKKIHQVGNKNWVQDFIFGLHSFFCDATINEYHFFKISPKDLDLVEMIATKQEEENIVIDGKAYQAKKVYATLDSWFQSKFWSCQVWFDTKTFDYLKYESQAGMFTLQKTVLFKE